MKGAPEPAQLDEGVTATLKRALAEHYELREEIGRGASAVVFRAWDHKLRRPVAIKVLRPDVVAFSGSERFSREIATVAALSHPHIVALHDSGEAAGTLYYVMPLVDGESLRQRLRRERQLPLDDALRITRDVASALQHAHDRGLVHRDVKPENILITGSSASALADFGLARVTSARDVDALTHSGMAVGTAAYMSPEQASGDIVDARSDQYALACVLFEMLAGVPPFHAVTVQGMLARHRADAPPLVRSVRGSIPQGIEDALLRAMAKLPADRFASVSEFVRTLEGALTRETLAAVVQERFSSAESVRHDTDPTGRNSRALVVGASMVVIVALVAWLGRTIIPREPLVADTDSSLVAVAPFDVFDARDEVWRNGMVDLLSRRFDGAGPLHTVSPSEVLRVFRGRADVASATALGAATRAGLVVFGQVARTPHDSVRLTGVLFDLRSKRSFEVDLRNALGAFDLLIDSVTVRLLRELARSRALAATPRATLGTRSIASLKLFLRAEQARRGNDYTEALRLYEAAIAADSSFALAYRGASRSLAITNESDPTAMRYATQAGQRNHRLAAIDSLMLLADSLAAALPTGPVLYDEDALRMLRRRLSALHEATQLKPGDPEVWTQLAEAYVHFGYRVGITAEQSLQAFERATAADSGYAPAYFHTLELSLARRSADSARKIAQRFLKASPNDSRFKAVAELISDTAAVVASGRARMLRLPPDSLMSVAYLMRRWYGRDDFAELAYRALLKAPHDNADVDSASVRRWLALHLMHRGRLLAAVALNDPPATDPVPLNSLLLAERGLIRGVDLDSAAARWVIRGRVSDQLAAASWFSARGHVASLRALGGGTRGTTGRRGALTGADVLAAGYLRALLSLSSGDSATALRQLRHLPDSLCSWVCWPVVRLTSRLLVATDSAVGAGRLLDRHPPAATSTSFVESEWLIERIWTARRAGDSAKAAAVSRQLEPVWRGADASFRSQTAAPARR